MKVLILKRQQLGGASTLATLLADELNRQGIQATLEDATSWMPQATGGKVDKEVTQKLRKLAEPYDLVHAINYRCAWACAEAFAMKEAWLYTAYDLPKTIHTYLIDRLNQAQAGLCASRAVLQALDRGLALDLQVTPPGLPPPPEPPDKRASRKVLGLPEEGPVVGSLGRWSPERDHVRLIEDMEVVWSHVPDAVLALAGSGPREAELDQAIAARSQPDRIRKLGAIPHVEPFLTSLDLFVHPGPTAGFSMAALEAMRLGIPVLVPDTGGLNEVIDPDVSGEAWRSFETPGAKIGELLRLPLTLESYAHAGRLRVRERFGLEPRTRDVVEVYRSILEDL